MNADANCEILYKFPSLTTYSEQFFGYSMVDIAPPNEKAMLHRIRPWMSSFTLQDFDLYEVDAAPSEIKGKIKDIWLNGHFDIMSVADSMKYVAILSIVNRLVELVFLSIQTQINQSTKFGPKMKFAAVVCLNVLRFYWMFYLGHPPVELAAHLMINVVLIQILPYKLSNFVKEVDFLSNDKGLHARDFILRNVLVFARNCFLTGIIFNSIFAPSSPSGDVLISSLVIQFCNASGVHFIANDSVKKLFFLTVELARALGKILMDLISAYILQNSLKVEDLRDPLHTLLPLKIRKWIGSYNQPWRLPAMIKKDIERKQKAQIVHSQNKKKLGNSRQRHLPVDVDYAQQNSWVPVNDAKAGRIKKGKKVKKAEEVEEVEAVQKSPLIWADRDHAVGNQLFKFIQLTGDDKYNTNMRTWGVIIEDTVHAEHFDSYSKHWDAGVLGRELTSRK